jgi:hypothetical protein
MKCDIDGATEFLAAVCRTPISEQPLAGLDCLAYCCEGHTIAVANIVADGAAKIVRNCDSQTIERGEYSFYCGDRLSVGNPSEAAQVRRRATMSESGWLANARLETL